MKKITLLFILVFGLQIANAQTTCTTALPAAAGMTTVGTILGTEIPTPNCMGGTATIPLSEWYSYTPTQNYTVTITTDLEINTGLDTRIHVYTGTCGNLVCYASDDDTESTLLSA